MAQIYNMKQMEGKLQKADRKHAQLYLFCNFTALMIISAYSALMLSKTVQTVFPEGGDSRKQMYAIFVLTLAGCVVFTIYAAGLFFRRKSRQLGVLMALGASRKSLAQGIFGEVLFLSGLSALAGIVAGFPFVWAIWGVFRLALVDSSEMALVLDFKCLFISLAFFLLVVGLACLNAWRYLKKTNIIDVIREEHINEPVKELGRWCGAAGFLTILAGAAMGYNAPGIWMARLHMYPPSWLSVLYAPVFAGVYMVMLHTVVHGWKSQKIKPYKNIISRGMMKFQAKQTVNSLIIVTLLIAGASFAMFYIPVGGIAALLSYYQSPYDYFYHYRADQKAPEEGAVRELAQKYGLALKDWEECEYITLGIGGNKEIADGDKHFHVEYAPICSEGKILSEDAYHALTNEAVDVAPGTYRNITNEDETSIYKDDNAKDLTNMATRKHADTKFAGYLHFGLLTDEIGYYVLDNADYAALAEGLTDEWRGRIVRFNVDGEDSYQFAREFYRLFVASFDDSCEHPSYYDRVQKIMANEEGEVYWMDTEAGESFKLTYGNLDSMAFRISWVYRPSFRILQINDYLQNMGVLYMMFLFIFIVCLTTALVVCYTRCQTIVLNNRYIFDDLRKLGASPAFLLKEVRSQCKNVFQVPSFVGTGAMYVLFTLILYANDGQVTFYEGVALLVCFAILMVIGAVVYAVYRATVSATKGQLGI